MNFGTSTYYLQYSAPPCCFGVSWREASAFVGGGIHMAINWQQAQPAPQALWALVHVNFPEARNLGIYSPRNVAGTNTPSAHAEGRALDIGLLVSRPREKTIGDGLFEALQKVGTVLGVDHVIW